MRVARQALTRAGSSRVGPCVGLAALVLLLGSKGLQTAVAEGDTRTISLHHIHTGEDLTITYKRDGRYDDEALKKVDHLLRDWRKNEEIHMDPRLLDVVWEVYRDVDAKGPIQVVCGYRSPATNAMLRSRSRGVAEYSQHMLGHAMDFFIPGVPLEKQREAGLRLQRGGVGYYPTSGSPFVHMDVGGVRMWPRMSHDELARVFPNGRTVYVPSDGKPLGGYALALADIEKRGSSAPSQMSLDEARAAGVDTPASAKPQRNLFAALFRGKDEEEDEAASRAATVPAAAPAAAKSTDAKPPKTADARHVTVPPARPTRVAAGPAPAAAPGSVFSVASAESRPVALTTPRVAEATAPMPVPVPANDVIAARGYWPDSAPTAQARALRDAVSARAQRPATETTGAVTPWPVRVADASDHVPSDLALAYAGQTHAAPPAAPVTRGLTVGAATPRDAAAPSAAAKPAAPMATVAVKPGVLLEDPWLRALVLAPDLQNYMTATPLVQADMRELRTLMDKPDAVVTMAFSNDPQPGLVTDHFSGSAVVFVSTVAFAKRTAALR
jgi:uncharacterized protein YcbK (DUF882 family)